MLTKPPLHLISSWCGHIVTKAFSFRHMKNWATLALCTMTMPLPATQNPQQFTLLHPWLWTSLHPWTPNITHQHPRHCTFVTTSIPLPTSQNPNLLLDFDPPCLPSLPTPNPNTPSSYNFLSANTLCHPIPFSLCHPMTFSIISPSVLI